MWLYYNFMILCIYFLRLNNNGRSKNKLAWLYGKKTQGNNDVKRSETYVIPFSTPICASPSFTWLQLFSPWSKVMWILSALLYKAMARFSNAFHSYKRRGNFECFQLWHSITLLLIAAEPLIKGSSGGWYWGNTFTYWWKNWPFHFLVVKKMSNDQNNPTMGYLQFVKYL